MAQEEFSTWHGTTIIGVKKDGKVVIAGDGQVSLGQTVIKGTAKKVRKLSPGGHDVIAGFAGSTADAFTLLERLESKLDAMPGQLARASVELAKDWRTDKYLQKLEAMLIVTDGQQLLVITGAGDVLEPEHDVAAIGSGGNYALAAARGMMSSEKNAEDIARQAMAIAADICVYTKLGGQVCRDHSEGFVRKAIGTENVTIRWGSPGRMATQATSRSAWASLDYKTNAVASSTGSNGSTAPLNVQSPNTATRGDIKGYSR